VAFPEQVAAEAARSHRSREQPGTQATDPGRCAEPPLELQGAPRLQRVLDEEGRGDQRADAEQDHAETGPRWWALLAGRPSVRRLKDPGRDDDDSDDRQHLRRPCTRASSKAGPDAADERAGREDPVDRRHEARGLDPLPSRRRRVDDNVEEPGGQPDQDEHEDEDELAACHGRQHRDQTEGDESHPDQPTGTEPIDEAPGHRHSRQRRDRDGRERQAELAVTEMRLRLDGRQQRGPRPPEDPEDPEGEQQRALLAPCRHYLLCDIQDACSRA
jgi:hypothetical protein